MDSKASIQAFLSGTAFAVAGASTDRTKFGNACLRCYLRAGYTVYPIHPTQEEIEGLPAFSTLSDLTVSVHGLTIVTPPAITASIVDEALALGIRHIWMQPGAEEAAAVARARAAGANVIHGGPCLLIELNE